MKYFGIKTIGEDPYIWWIAEDKHRAWDAFFTYPDKDRNLNAYRLPLYDAIRAYEAIGYKCVELEVKEKENEETNISS